jgi:NAD(P)-dependent dehydrogenase (short-subunit alcohol dehydrogenase family)
MTTTSYRRDMQDRTCLITGATSGIGRVTARELARRGARVLMVGRERTRGEALLDELKSINGGGQAELLIADLASQAAVRELARTIRQRTDRLHVLLNNAGVISLNRRLTVDGLESTFAINHLAPFLLTNLLADLLIASAPARVVAVASEAHRIGRIDFDDLQGERRYRGFQAYAQSKLANILFTYELSRRMSGKGVTVNCVHPGAVDSGLWRESRGLLRVALRAARPFFLTSEEGAAGLILLATSPALSAVSGRYFKKTREARSSKPSYDLATAARLWDVSATLAPLSSG